MATLPEPLLIESEERFTFFPIEKPNLYNLYKNSLAVFWQVEEIDFAKDRRDWEEKLTDNERYFIKCILGFFSSADGLIIENLASRFMKEVQISEARAFYAIQIAMEQIHSETYSLMIDTFILDKQERIDTLQSIRTNKAVEKKARWALKWMSSDASFALRLIAFAIVEGVFFSGAFASIYWLKERGLMPGLTLSNQFIARDEGIHTDFAVALYRQEVVNRIPQETIDEIFREAVEVEKYFITEALPVNLIGMNCTLMQQYIEFVCDRLMYQLGYNKMFKTENPFSWMEKISMEKKGNFFETRISEYAKAGVGKTKEEMSFSLDADF
jgi:ribonucleotide reductase beta subunit family protein with ferritin-like domain